MKDIRSANNHKLVEFENEMADCNVVFFDLGNKSLLMTKLPNDMVKSTLKACLKTLKSKDSISYDDRLAGQIYDGNQVEYPIDSDDPANKTLRETIEALSLSYCHRFWIKYGLDKKKSKRSFRRIQMNEISVSINDIWIVEQKDLDFNPLHDHNTKSPVGLSGVFYVRVPWQDDKPPGPSHNGLLKVLWGGQSNASIWNFTGPESAAIQIEDGMCVIFPKELTHMVEPYRKVYDKSRICVAFNVNVWYPNIHQVSI